MKRITIIGIALLVIVLAVIISMARATTQHSLSFEGETLGAFPVRGSNNQVEFSPGLTFHVSSVAPTTSMTRPTLEWLKSKGYVTDSTTRFLLSYDNHAGISFANRVYRVNIPISTYRYDYDSISAGIVASNDPTIPTRFIEGVDVVEGPAEEGNVLGLDFLKLFILERNHAQNSLSLHTKLPEGFELLGHFDANTHLSDIVTFTPHYYMYMKVDHIEHEFLMNTDLANISLRLPTSELPPYVNYRVRPIEIDDRQGHAYKGFIDQSAWIEFGNRAGSRMIYYIDPEWEGSEINPFVFFDQDMLIDFGGRAIYLRPYYKLRDLMS